jgi:hypothetical protein
MMNNGLKAAVERLIDCEASFLEDVVLEQLDAETVWSGTVSVFEISGHPQATRAYAWFLPSEGSTMGRYRIVLHIPPVDSPEKAVKASMIADSCGS